MKLRISPILLILFSAGLLFSKSEVISHAPKSISVIPVNEGAKVSWTFHLPDTVFSYNDSYPSGVWDPHFKQALGVILNLSSYPGATLEEIDFAHWGRNKIHGPYYYNILFFDMDSSKLYYRIDSLKAHDAYDLPRFEVGVPLGSVPARNRVGIFLQGLSLFTDSNGKKHSFPALMSDSSTYVRNVNYYLVDVDDPFYENDPKYTNFFESWQTANSDSNHITVTNYILDVWLNFNGSKIKISHHQCGVKLLPNPNKPENIYLGTVPKEVSDRALSVSQNDILDGFYIFRQTSEEDSLTKIAEINAEGREFIDSTTQTENNYIYGVAAYNAISLSKIITQSYFQPLIFSIHEAKFDGNNDFIPDRLDQQMAIRGTIISPNFSSNCQYFVSDGTGGIQLFSSDFNVPLSVGDSIFVSGQITQFKGLTELKVDTVARIQKLGRHSIDTLQIGLTEMGENLEGRLVAVDNLEIVNPEDWPVEGQNGTNLTVTDGQNTAKLYIDKDTDLDGWTPPSGKFRLVAIVDQYTSNTPANDGYELQPRFQTDFISTTAISGNAPMRPTTFALKPCYPNPFNPQTTIEYRIAKQSHVFLQVFDLRGQLVSQLKNEIQRSGTYKVRFNGQHLSSGIYLVHLKAGSFEGNQKIILLK